MGNFGGEKLANHELFAKNFLTNIHRYTKNVFGIYIDYSLFTKFFLANRFYLYGSPKFLPPSISCVQYYVKVHGDKEINPVSLLDIP